MNPISFSSRRSVLVGLSIPIVLLMFAVTGCPSGDSDDSPDDGNTCSLTECVIACVTAGRSGGSCVDGACICTGGGDADADADAEADADEGADGDADDDAPRDADDGADADDDTSGDADDSAAAVCGNGVVEPGEECDDGNDVAGDGCEPTTCLFSCHVASDCNEVPDDRCTLDTCDTMIPPGQICHHAPNPGAICDDGSRCTHTDRCGVGPGECDGMPYTCVAAACEASATCDGAGGCDVTYAVVGTTCNDGDTCTETDTCDGSGNCLPGPNRCDCPGGTDAECATFEDGNRCNGTLRCVVATHECEVDPLTIVSCPMAPPCQAYTCEPADGSCSLSDLPSGTSCGDGAYCNGAETCDGAGACMPGTPPCPVGACIAGCDETRDACVPATRGLTCRTAAGPCDVAETCDGTGLGCPTDTLATAAVECRSAVDACDLPESCTGASTQCPPDRLASAGTICRAAAGACDVADTCDGISVGCPSDELLPSSVVCRVATGPCDVEDRCTGSASSCPADTFQPPTTACRLAAGDCDLAEYCTGLSASCLADAFRPPTSECRAAVNVCDAPEYCTGLSISCPSDTLRAATTVCRPASDACDAPDYCTGSSVSCPADALRLSGTVCRAAAGDCDLSESCTGSSASCPDDVVRPSNTVCRGAGGPCDLPESCTGSSPACPADAFVSRLRGIARIAAGYYHACALTSAGAVKCWGNNAYGQLGDGTTTDRATPTNVSGLASGVTAITAGTEHTCAVTSAGAVKCWGSNNRGQLGDGTTTDRPTPTDVAGLSAGAVAVVGGTSHSCVVTSTGAVKCWGYNAYGQIGDGTTTDRPIPTNVSGLSSGVIAIAAGQLHTCALTSAGAVKCWGYNGYGQIGDGTTTDRPIPTNVSGLSLGVTAIAASRSHSCAVTSAGVAKCWGWNLYGQLGNGTMTDRAIPTNVSGLSSGVTAIAAGQVHTCALTSAGAVKCWGENSSAELGDGTRTRRTSPVDVAGLSSGTTAVAAGGLFTCALTSAGTVSCWGVNSSGQLGDGTTGSRLTPTDVAGLSSGLTATAVGGSHTCALGSAGSVKCWGENSSGQLGDGTTVSATAPVDVAGLFSGVAAIGAGASHSCALTSAGSVKCWGGNTYGQLGDGTTTDRPIPTDVAGLSSGVAAITATCWLHTCALTSAGGVKCWGNNANGQIGDGTTTTSTVPAGVVGLSSNVTAVGAGGFHSCALTSAGGVKCWGRNANGQLGDGTMTDRPTPTDVAGLSSGVTAVAAGGHTCALTSAGAVKCWGRNTNGQLGDGTTTDRPTPTDVAGLSSGVTAIAVGMYHTCALTSTGAVKCWGYNAHGQLGDGTATDSTILTDVSGLSSGVAAIAAGGYVTCALVSGGPVKCWGADSSGQVSGFFPGYSHPVCG